MSDVEDDEVIDRMAAAAIEAATVPKRRPGRPPSKKKANMAEKSGIVTTPIKESHRIEFTTFEPSTFKKIFAYFKKNKSRTIYFIFTQNTMQIYTKSHNERVKMLINVDNTIGARYYCRDERLILQVERDDLETTFNGLDAKIPKFSIVYDGETEDRMSIYVTNPEGKKEHLTVNANPHVEDAQVLSDIISLNTYLLPETITREFAVSITIGCTTFKRWMDKAQKETPTISIDGYGERTQFHYTLQSRKVECPIEDIQLKTDYIHTVMGIEYIHPITKCLIGDNIKIHCRNMGVTGFETFTEGKYITMFSLINAEMPVS